MWGFEKRLTLVSIDVPHNMILFELNGIVNKVNWHIYYASKCTVFVVVIWFRQFMILSN